MPATIQKILKPTKYRAVDTSGNNNHGQIYSGRGLEFDGISDRFSVPVVADVTSFTNGEPWTWACWMYFNSSGATQYFVGNYDTTHPHFFRTSGSFPAMRASNAKYFRTSSTFNLENKWIRVVYVASSDNTLTTYINGEQYGDVITTSTANFDPGDGVTFPGTEMKFTGWGTPYESGGFSQGLNGKMSDGQVWDAAWSASDVTFDYLNPESLALNNGGTSLTESNLKLWYPMQDGHRGQQSYILDGANTGVGPDLLPVGQFNSNSGFATVGTGWSISNGIASCDGTQSGSSDIQFEDNTNFVSPDENGPWKINFTLSNYSAGILTVGMGGYNFSSSITANGDYSILTTPTNTSSNNRLYLRGNADFIGSLSNITVHKVNDKHHATTVFHGDDSAVNGTFASSLAVGDADDQWVDDNNGDASSNVDLSIVSTGGRKTSGSDDEPCLRLTLDGTAVTGYVSYRKDDYVIGRTYYAECYVNDHSNTGVNTLQLHAGEAKGDETTSGNSASVPNVAFDGTWTNAYVEFVATATTMYIKFEIVADANDDTCSIDDFSIKEVGVATGWTDADQQLDIPQTALQSYNQLAWFSGGSTSHVQLSGDILKNPHNSNVSYSFNVMRNITTDQHMVFCDEDTTSLRKIRFTGDGRILIESNTNENNVIATLAANDTNWHHYVITCASGTVKFYQDGQLLTNTNSDTLTDAIRLRRIGKGTSKGMEGCITECAIWDVTLSQVEVHELYNNGKTLDARLHSENTNLAHYWQNNGIAIWKDLAGDKDGTPTNVTETLLIPAGVDASRDNQGFLMNRQKTTNSLNLPYCLHVDGYVDLGSVTTVPAGDAFSLTLWLKPSQVSNNKFIAASDSDYIRIRSTNTIRIYANSNSDDLPLDSGSWVADEWVHIGIVRDTSNDTTLYINGEAQSTTKTVSEDIKYRYIGATGASTYTYDGAIDDVCIYHDELSATEVKRNYNAGKRSHK